MKINKNLIKNFSVKTKTEETEETEESDKKFKKYVRQFINLVSSTKKGTVPSKVGQLSEQFRDYLKTLTINEEPTIKGWRDYYYKNPIKNNKSTEEKELDKTKKSNPLGEQAILEASHEIFRFLNDQYKPNIDSINEEDVKKWVEDLVIEKTFKGFILDEEVAKISILELSKLDKNIINDDQLKKSKNKWIHLRAADKTEDAEKIDFFYEYDSTQIKLQIKIGDSNWGKEFRKRNIFSQEPSDVFVCLLDIENDDEWNLSIYNNGAWIIK